jgi:hypothetical protein
MQQGSQAAWLWASPDPHRASVFSSDRGAGFRGAQAHPALIFPDRGCVPRTEGRAVKVHQTLSIMAAGPVRAGKDWPQKAQLQTCRSLSQDRAGEWKLQSPPGQVGDCSFLRLRLCARSGRGFALDLECCRCRELAGDLLVLSA